jgi:manganese efflux pump family protein
MTTSTLLALAVALGTDAFSLSIGLGMAGINKRNTIILSITVLIFHILMPLLGVWAGEIFGSLLGKTANIIGALVLIGLGLKMIKDSFSDEEEENPQILLANTKGLVLIAGSVSLDALSVGFSLGTQNVNLTVTSLTIGLVAGLMTAAGLVFGRFIGGWIGDKAKIIGAVILLGIGAKFLL